MKIKILLIGILIFFIYGSLVVFVHNKTEPLAGYIKIGDFKEAYKIAVSTTLFNNYNYSRMSNSIISDYYMYGIDNIVKQSFVRSEEYCLMSKEQCNINYLYNGAISYYCQDKSIEFMAHGYENNQTEEYNKKKCAYSKKRLQKIEQLGDKAYELPIFYWLPRFR